MQELFCISECIVLEFSRVSTSCLNLEILRGTVGIQFANLAGQTQRNAAAKISDPSVNFAFVSHMARDQLLCGARRVSEEACNRRSNLLAMMLQ